MKQIILGGLIYLVCIIIGVFVDSPIWFTIGFVLYLLYLSGEDE